MNKVHPCQVCDCPAVGCYSPDLDIKGLCFCEKHRETVQLAYLALIQGDKELCNNILDE